MSDSSVPQETPLAKNVARSTHTPGPWQVLTKLSGSENHKGFRLWADRGWIGDLSPCDPDGKVGRANADLIAAAPDLLEALQRLADAEHAWEQDIPGWQERLANARVEADAAIKKARGA